MAHATHGPISPPTWVHFSTSAACRSHAVTQTSTISCFMSTLQSEAATSGYFAILLTHQGKLGCLLVGHTAEVAAHTWSMPPAQQQQVLMTDGSPVEGLKVVLVLGLFKCERCRCRRRCCHLGAFKSSS